VRIDEFREELDALVAQQPAPFIHIHPRRALRQRRSRIVAIGSAIALAGIVTTSAVVIDRHTDRTALDLELIATSRPPAGSALVAETVTLTYQKGARVLERQFAGRLEIDFRAGSAIAVLRPPGNDDPAEISAHRVVDGDSFIRYPASDRAALALPTEWVGIRGGADAPGYFGAEVPSLAPSSVLTHLGSGREDIYRSVEVVGNDIVGGIGTTHYRLVADPDALRGELVGAGMAEQLVALVDFEETTELWVDEDRLIRRVRVSQREAIPLAGWTISVTFDQRVIEYGNRVERVVPPHAADVTWLSPAELGRRFGKADPFEPLRSDDAGSP
jgi:hypothetical protein